MQENKLNPDKSVKFAILRILQNHVSEIFIGKIIIEFSKQVAEPMTFPQVQLKETRGGLAKFIYLFIFKSNQIIQQPHLKARLRCLPQAVLHL